MLLHNCHNFHDFRRLAKRRLPGPIFDYIDGAADDEVTHRRNTKAFETCDLIPDVLRGVENVDLSVTVMGQHLALPFYCSPTALQRLFHHQGERAVAAAAAKYGTMFGVSSLGTVSLEELRKAHDTPQVYQFYFHKDRGLNRTMLQRAKEARVEIMMLTVDSTTGGNRERDLRTGFSIPFRLTLAGMVQFAIKPMWGINYATHERFRLPQLDEHVDMSGRALSIGRYFTEMLDPSMNWDDVAEMVRQWNGQFCLKGIMSTADAKRAVEIGCTGIVVSNHGGRQLDGSRASFDHLTEIVDTVGDRIDVLMDGGIQRGTHVLKALSVGAKAVGVDVLDRVVRHAEHDGDRRRCILGRECALAPMDAHVVRIIDALFAGDADGAQSRAGLWSLRSDGRVAIERRSGSDPVPSENSNSRTSMA